MRSRARREVGAAALTHLSQSIGQLSQLLVQLFVPHHAVTDQRLLNATPAQPAGRHSGRAGAMRGGRCVYQRPVVAKELDPMTVAKCLKLSVT